MIPTTSDINSVGVARLFQDYIWRHHGLPEEIISDRGTQFVSQFMRELNKLLGIKTTASTAYHSKTNGQTEHINQDIEQYLRLFVNQYPIGMNGSPSLSSHTTIESTPPPKRLPSCLTMDNTQGLE